MVGKDELDQAERNRAHERDQEPIENVVRARAEEDEHRRIDRREPWSDASTTHHDEQQRRHSEVTDDAQHLVWNIRAQAEQLPQEAIRKDRQREPMLEVRTKEIAKVPGPAVSEKIPLVEDEPASATKPQQKRKRRNLDRDEQRHRPVLANAPTTRAGPPHLSRHIAPQPRPPKDGSRILPARECSGERRTGRSDAASWTCRSLSVARPRAG